MVKLMEPVLRLAVAEKDKGVMAKLVPQCEQEYEALMKKETGREEKCKLILDESSTRVSEQDCGGVTLSSEDGRIVCANTLGSKLRLVYDQLLPEIRKLLFPKK